MDIAVCNFIATALPATRQWWRSRLYPIKAGTWFSDPGGMQGWVDLVGRLHTAMVYSPEDGHPSQYEPGSVYCCIVDTPNDADHYYAMPRAKVLLWWLLLGGDTVDYIMSRMSDQSKSRRQVVRQLVQLGLIGSAKELKKMRSPLVGLLTRTITTCSTHLLAFRDLRPSVFDEETTGQLLYTYTPRHTRGELEITSLNLRSDGAIEICLLLFFIPQVVKIPGLKTKNAKIKTSDGHRSGRSTGRVSCKSKELLLLLLLLLYNESFAWDGYIAKTDWHKCDFTWP